MKIRENFKSCIFADSESIDIIIWGPGFDSELLPMILETKAL